MKISTNHSPQLIDDYKNPVIYTPKRDSKGNITLKRKMWA